MKLVWNQTTEKGITHDLITIQEFILKNQFETSEITHATTAMHGKKTEIEV
jgi:hypothetical protein